MTRPRLRWTALLLAASVVSTALVGLRPEAPGPAPPGADGDPLAVVRQVADDRPDDRPGDRPDDRPGDRPAGHATAPDAVVPGHDAGLDTSHADQQRRLEHPRGAERRPDVADEAAGVTSGADQRLDPGPDPGFVPARVTDEGFEVVGGTARAGAGERVAYTVEVDPTVDVDPLAFTAAVERALHDPRSWAADAELVRVDDPAEARIRVVLAAPAEVDRLCAEAGLNTAGRFSCWNGRIAALNAVRWMQGAADFDDLDVYRTYLVNHEFGHGLGRGHVDCPGIGRAAPIMMQQTMSTGACVANGWPYPERSAD